MILQTKPLAEITHDAFRALSREIGIVNTIRFLNQFTTGHGNYTQERKEIFADLTLTDMISSIKKKGNKRK